MALRSENKYATIPDGAGKGELISGLAWRPRAARRAGLAAPPGRLVVGSCRGVLFSPAGGGDVADGGGGVDGQVGGAGVLEGVADPADGGAGVEGGGGPGGGADGDRAGLGGQLQGAAGGLGDADAAPGGAELRVAAEVPGGDVAVDDGDAGGGRLADVDGGLGAVEGDFAEWAGGGELGAGGGGLDR